MSSFPVTIITISLFVLSSNDVSILNVDDTARNNELLSLS